MATESEKAAAALVGHLKSCRKVSAALVGGVGVDMTPTVEAMIAAGWTYGGTEYINGKRIRYLTPPEGGPRAAGSV